MTKLLLRLPWFVSTPALLALAAALAFGANLVISDYFERTFLDEADPLGAAGLIAASATKPASQATARATSVSTTQTPQASASPSPGTAPASESAPPPRQQSEPSPPSIPAEQPPVDEAAGTAVTPPPAATATSPASQPTNTPEVEEFDPASTSTPVPATPAPISTPAPPTATPLPIGVLAQGEFRDGLPGHNGSGIAKLQRLPDGSLNLRFENFSVTGGPDLFVHLATGASNYSLGEASLDLGENKATDGDINYPIPTGTDVSQYDTVVIWCRGAAFAFALATLVPV